MHHLFHVSCTAKSVSSTDKSDAGTDRSIDRVLSDGYEDCAPALLRPMRLGLPFARGLFVGKTIEGDSTRSWLHRARPECTSSAPAEHDPAARTVDDGSGDCWDPWDIWLRYIDQPRRRRDEQRSTSAD